MLKQEKTLQLKNKQEIIRIHHSLADMLSSHESKLSSDHQELICPWVEQTRVEHSSRSLFWVVVFPRTTWHPIMTGCLHFEYFFYLLSALQGVQLYPIGTGIRKIKQHSVSELSWQRNLRKHQVCSYARPILVGQNSNQQSAWIGQQSVVKLTRHVNVVPILSYLYFYHKRKPLIRGLIQHANISHSSVNSSGKVLPPSPTL